LNFRPWEILDVNQPIKIDITKRRRQKLSREFAELRELIIDFEDKDLCQKKYKQNRT